MCSVEVLVVWVIYCVVFNAVHHIHPGTMKGFGVALKLEDLGHLILHDRLPLTVMERIAMFLHDKNVQGRDVFSTRQDGQGWNSQTFVMGERYVQTHFKSIWKKETINANHRTDKHWNEIVRKQQLTRELKQELSELESDRDYESTRVHDYDRYGNQTRQGRDAQKEVNRLNSRIQSKTNEINHAEKAPPHSTTS